MNDVIDKKLTRKERLEKKKAQIIAQLRAIDSAEKKKKRKQDTRQKIIIGAIVMNHMEHNRTFAEQIKNLVEEHASSADKKFLGESLGLTIAEFEKAASREKTG